MTETKAIKSQYTNEIKSQYLIASRIVCKENIKNEEVLLKDNPPQACLGYKNICEIPSGAYVLLDFGEEISGGIEITFQVCSKDNPKLRVVFGESVSEALSDIGFKNSTNDHSLRDITVNSTDYSNMRLGYTGFRFVKLQCVGGNLAIAGVRAVSEYRDIEYLGSFECNDDLLNKIWKIGARTVHLNMQNYLLDGIKRDRLVWVGDMHAEVSAIMSVFGYNDIVEKSLDLIRDTTSVGEWMNNLPSYSFWWLILHHDWYTYTGNKETILNNRQYIISLAKFILESINDDGTDNLDRSGEKNISNNPYQMYFIDWGTLGKECAKTGFYAIAAMALDAVSKLLAVTDDIELSKLCQKKADAVRRFELPKTQDRQCAALCALSGIKDADEVNKTILSKEPVADITAFLGYYVLLAKGMANDVSGALDIIKKYWGRMIELGATTFWEYFDYMSSFGAAPIDEIVPPGKTDVHGDFGSQCYEGYRCSLCHGWACGPTPFISRYVLGVEILEPGCKKLRIKPDLGNLKWIKGTYPTPYGLVEIYAENQNGKTVVKINKPDEIIVEQ